MASFRRLVPKASHQWKCHGRLQSLDRKTDTLKNKEHLSLVLLNFSKQTCMGFRHATGNLVETPILHCFLIYLLEINPKRRPPARQERRYRTLGFPIHAIKVKNS